ncbi:MAG: formylglycine-generating enzyme family protein [Candidatus Omnitrophota bacterium]
MTGFLIRKNLKDKLVSLVLILSVIFILDLATASADRQEEITGKNGAPMVLVPAGEFLMGSTSGDADLRWEHPQHKVFLDAYYIDKYKVTVAQYRKFCQETGRSMPSEPAWGWQDNHPIVKVSWNDAVAYANHYGKRLPTEAEWEKACRAGSTTKYCFGNSGTNLGDYAWYSVNSNKQTHPVGTKKPNAFGIYDMHGTVWEWCNDWYNENYYKSSPTNNPNGPSGGPGRVLRGGGWYSSAGYCRSAFRNWDPPSFKAINYGFRCAWSAPGTTEQ